MTFNLKCLSRKATKRQEILQRKIIIKIKKEKIYRSLIIATTLNSRTNFKEERTKRKGNKKS